MRTYDEADIKARLSRLDRAGRTAFAAACAERMWPLFTRCVEATGMGDVTALRTVLDDLWRAAGGEDVGDLSLAQATAEQMIPIDDGAWTLEVGYGQYATAAVAYAVRAWLTDDPQEATWAARQIHEAADHAALCARPDLQLNVPGTERLLLESPMVQTALAGLATDLATVESPSAAGQDDLRTRARDEGEAWAATLPGTDR
ncbi:DUF416 family protein [Jiangella rhizosphaerae]|uniref:DUF416 family protein n=1 Tax=Jiangella rhizosphaerae TaxID=2293569 RepID=A0A418KH72_9ACTN|nr:DUF416 family protein [Jiangella rhizosphaerae]RIQ11446.1 DUF416 family protein [Jiangella rhizosphaerae]